MIGTKVVLASYQSHLGRVAYYTIAEIEKVYKNGNVVIKGEQWKPSHDKRTFHAVGRTQHGSFNRNYYAIYDDELVQAYSRS